MQTRPGRRNPLASCRRVRKAARRTGELELNLMDPQDALAVCGFFQQLIPPPTIGEILSPGPGSYLPGAGGAVAGPSGGGPFAGGGGGD